MTRSTVPLFSFLKHGGDVLNAFMRALVGSQPVSAYLEDKFPVARGRRTASHTDLVLVCPDVAVAVEAKWTKPRYERCTEWLMPHKPNLGNRSAVLSGWLSLLQPFTLKALSIDDVGQAVYQTLHRASSACSFGLKPELVDLQFTPSPDGGAASSAELLADLNRLHEAIGSPPDLRFRLIQVALDPHPSFSASGC